jgi:uncharacterized phiE125 gp8 family phage protein
MSYELDSVRTQGMEVVVISDLFPIPITLAKAKNYLNVDFTEHDDRISSLISSAFREIELFTELGLKPKTVRLSYTEINGTVLLPFYPIKSITSVTDLDGLALVNEIDYQLSNEKNKLSCYNSNGIVITYECGYTSLPRDLENAILEIVGVDFDNKSEDKRVALKSIKDRIRHYRPIYV